MYLIAATHAWDLAANYLQMSVQFSFHCRVPHFIRRPSWFVFEKVSRQVFTVPSYRQRHYAQGNDTRNILIRAWSRLRRVYSNHCVWLSCMSAARRATGHRSRIVLLKILLCQLNFKINRRHQWLKASSRLMLLILNNQASQPCSKIGQTAAAWTPWQSLTLRCTTKSTAKLNNSWHNWYLCRTPDFSRNACFSPSIIWI